MIKAYLGSPVVVVQDLSDGTSVVTAAEIVSTGDLYDYTLNTASVPQVAENEPAPPADVPDPGATGSPQPVDITTADYSGPDRRLITRRSGGERRVA
jgi:hypothetical protein